MPPLPERRRMRLRRETQLIVLATALFGVVYFGFLAYQNHRAAGYYENLRKTDPARYLDDVRKNEGFASYLDKYRLLEGYYVFKQAVPSFIVGRWTMHKTPQRVAPGTVFADCADPVAFETGLVEVGGGPGRARYQIRYRLIGQGLVLNGLEVPVLEIGLVSYGAAIDHLEFTPPGQHTKVYAYRCGN